MRRAVPSDKQYLVEQSVAAARWYYPGARPGPEKIGAVVGEALSGSKHFVAVDGGAVIAHVTPNPFGEKQIATILLWVGSPWLMRAVVRWVAGRPGIRGIHAPIDPPERIAAFLVRLGFERGQGGYFWWR